ncbi:MAG: hypothetical protein Q3966_06245 [Neisseria sp.]|nr:hypothetical protein [Neisseria sp.]
MKPSLRLLLSAWLAACTAEPPSDSGPSASEIQLQEALTPAPASGNADYTAPADSPEDNASDLPASDASS